VGFWTGDRVLPNYTISDTEIPKCSNPCGGISAAANMDQRNLAAISTQAKGRDLSTSTSAYGVTGGAVVFTELKYCSKLSTTSSSPR
jgi:hypothetical protein